MSRRIDVYVVPCPTCGAAAAPGQTIRNGGHVGGCLNGHFYRVCQVHGVATARKDEDREGYETCTCGRS